MIINGIGNMTHDDISVEKSLLNIIDGNSGQSRSIQRGAPVNNPFVGDSSLVKKEEVYN